MFYDIGNCVPYIIKTLHVDARDAQRKAAKAAVHRRTKRSSPSRLRGRGADVGLPTLFCIEFCAFRHYNHYNI